MRKSFHLLRTNPALTTNYTLNVDSNYKLYLESIDSLDILSDLKYKKQSISQDSLLYQVLPKFWSNMNADFAYYVRELNNPTFVQDDYSDQYDDIYWTGGNYISNQSYSEEFEYLAPLYIYKNYIPNSFIIFRVDNHGLLENNGVYYSLDEKNFKDEILKKLKVVKYFDLTENSNLGHFLNKNFSLATLPDSPIFYNYKILSFSYWNGYNYANGGIVNKSKILDDWHIRNTPFYELEKKIIDEFKNLGVICSNILNLKYLFDDEPSTPTKLKKYSNNRYYGFYFDDMETVKSLTPYHISFNFKENKQYSINNKLYWKYIIQNNIFLIMQFDVYGVPLLKNNEPIYLKWNSDPIQGGWRDDKDNNYWYWYNSKYLKISRRLELNNNITQWVYFIVSDQFLNIIIDDPFSTMIAEQKKSIIKISYENDLSYLYLVDNLSNLTKLRKRDLFDITIDNSNDYFKYIFILTPSQTQEELSYLKEYDLVKYNEIINIWNSPSLNKEELITSYLENYYWNLSDLYLVQIGIRYFTLNSDTNGNIYIFSDEKIESDVKELRIIKNLKSDENPNGQDPIIIDLKNVSPIFGPIVINMFRMKFTDIKDFDFDRVDTKQTEHEYEDINLLSDSTEPKMYYKEWFIDSEEPNGYIEVINNIINAPYEDLDNHYIPISSEYLLSAESFVIKNNEISNIWYKNQYVNKWGYSGSVSGNDYPYRLNNTIDGGHFNFTTNFLSEVSSWKDKNFDYFYYNWPVILDLNKNNKNYNHIWSNWYNFNVKKINLIENTYPRLLNLIEDPDLDIDTVDNLSTTFNPNIFSFKLFSKSNEIFDYFDIFFNSNTYYTNSEFKKIPIIKNIANKSSSFVLDIDNTNNHTVFKGLKYKIKKVLNITSDEDSMFIEDIITSDTNEFKDYRFSVIAEFINEHINTSFRTVDDTYILSDPNEGIIYTKPQINIIINKNIKAIVIRIEIPSKWKGIDRNLQEIFLWNNNTKGRVDRFLYRDNPKWKDWDQSKIKQWKLEEIAIFLNYGNSGIDENGTGILLHDVNSINSFNYIQLINNFYSSESSIIQAGEVIYTIIDNEYLKENLDFNYKIFMGNPEPDISILENTLGFPGKWQNFTLPYIIYIEEADNYASYVPAYNIVPLIDSKIELDILNRIDGNELNPITKNLNYIKKEENISYQYVENLIPSNFDLLSVDNRYAISFFKHSGYYEPIFNNVNIFQKYNYYELNRINENYLTPNNYKINGNYKFDTTLVNFGILNEIIISKVNLSGSILKSKNSTNPAKYPRIDEWGYDTTNFNIFKSRWDIKFYYEYKFVRNNYVNVESLNLNAIIKKKNNFFNLK